MLMRTEKRGKIVLSVIIPCYNEQGALPFFYKESTKVLSSMEEDYELIFVNDGSKDNTLPILKDLQSKDPCAPTLDIGVRPQCCLSRIGQ